MCCRIKRCSRTSTLVTEIRWRLKRRLEKRGSGDGRPNEFANEDGAVARENEKREKDVRNKVKALNSYNAVQFASEKDEELRR